MKVGNYDVSQKDDSAIYKMIPLTIKKDGTGYGTTLYITKCPTCNCQVSCLGFANELLKVAGSVRADVQAILRSCYKQIGMDPKLILLDVHQIWNRSVESCFTVVTKTLYRSTNGSDMCTYLVKLD